MHKKILGVVGGLGPIATAHFLELVTRMTNACTEQDHLDMIIYDFPSIPDRTGYIQGSNLKSPLPGLLSVGRALSRQGVSCIAVPCVTAHYFFPELTASISTPIIDAVAETVRHLQEQGITRAGIMATDGTIYSGLFSRALSDAGVAPVIPSALRQADVISLIYDHIKAGLPADMDRFRSIQAELLEKGSQVIILGCTELSLIKRDFPIGAGFIDTMEVLAQQALLRCGKTLKEEYRCLITR